MKDKESTSTKSATSLTKFSTFQLTALLKLITSDGRPTRYSEMKRHPSASTLWPNLTRITQTQSSAPWCTFRSSCSFLQLSCAVSLPHYYKHLHSSYKTTCAAEVQGSEIMPVMRDFSFSLLPLLLIKCE